MSESEIQQQIMIEGPKIDSILLRNNSGCFTDITGRIVRYGLMNTSKKQNEQIKSSDLIGITVITVTPEMVGKKLGIFTAVEVKKSDWNPNKKLDKHEQAQKNFTDWIVNCGGFAGFANSVDSFRKILGR